MQDLVGKTLGKYEIIEKIGEGGMAQVYKAYQPGPDRYVAIKVMHGNFIQEPGFQDRFHREARAIARLSHPNIVRLYDYDFDGEMPYMIMEYIEGQTLKDEVDKWQESGAHATHDFAHRLKQSVYVGARLADAIDYAHRQRVIHRDIKPSNILISKENHVYLTDFGLAQIKDSTHETSVGFVGTPAYVSPELAMRVYPITRLTDIYSLGVVIYEMLAGRPPFEGDIEFLLRSHMEERPPDLPGFSAEISQNLEMVMQRVLAKSPHQRFQSATAFIKALRWAQDRSRFNTPPNQVGAPLNSETKPVPRPASIPKPTGSTTDSHPSYDNRSEVYLQHVINGEQFAIRSRNVLIGCSTRVDIDLSGLEHSEVTSSKHANIWRKQNGEYWIKDEHSTNGTVVNGQYLAGGKRAQLFNGSEIQFGKEGPILKFFVQSAS